MFGTQWLGFANDLALMVLSEPHMTHIDDITYSDKKSTEMASLI